MIAARRLVLSFGMSLAIVGGMAEAALGQSTPPVLVSAVSRLQHGGAGPLDISLALTGWATSETRSGGPTKIILKYDRAIAATPGPVVTVTGATLISAVPTGNTLTVDLSGTVNRTCVEIVLRGIASAADPSAVARSHVVKVHVRLGDVTNDGLVRGPANLQPGHPAFATSDVSQIQYYGPSGPIAPGTAKYDLDRSGGYGAGDLALVQSVLDEEISYCFWADGDADGVDDAADICPATVTGASVDVDGCSPAIPGDSNRDGDVDGPDVEAFMACASGPAIQRPDGCDGEDIDTDGDVDQDDFGFVQRCFSGAGLPADLSCRS